LSIDIAASPGRWGSDVPSGAVADVAASMTDVEGRVSRQGHYGTVRADLAALVDHDERRPSLSRESCDRVDTMG
jgi:hypothetical protein